MKFSKTESKELVERIENGDVLLKKVVDMYNNLLNEYNTATSTRSAMKVVIRHAFAWLEDGIYGGKDYLFDKEIVDNAVEAMHDDDSFFSAFMEFFQDHIDDFGENYGIEFDE